MRYLSRREYSSSELRQKLRHKGYSEAMVEQVVADLAAEGFQSDSRFAEVFVRSRVEKGYGAYWIREELRQRGVDIEEALEKERNWDELVRKVYIKKYGETIPDSLEQRAARERFLRRRGFESDHIRRLFKRLRHPGGE
ncbi:regulatory protein RecX [Methylocaldum sp.]|uniref:regulatory protein RecX n=1 Tax=Methylocaldum sp. TaxID=1969727 RepID=UPI0039C97986